MLAFQTVQTIAALYLPSLNADIIDKGVAHAATPATSGATGGWSCCSSPLVQIAFAIAAVYFGAAAAMGFGRDVRSDLFHQVTGFSAREVNQLRCAVADHPHHQRRAAGADARADDLHAARRRADHRGRRRHHGAARGRRPLAAARWSACPMLLLIVGSTIRRMVPTFRAMQDRIDRVNHGAARADHRHPRRAGLRARARTRRSASARANDRPHRDRRCRPAA